MGREFTNALDKTPLWQFALAAYKHHHHALLQWQDKAGANVNDLLVLAFVSRQQQALIPDWWQQARLQRTRLLIQRMRKLRRQHQGKPDYSHYKAFELALEGIDMLLLQACITENQQQLASNLRGYEQHLAIKKGALAPFLKTLLS